MTQHAPACRLYEAGFHLYQARERDGSGPLPAVGCKLLQQHIVFYPVTSATRCLDSSVVS